MGSKTIVFLGLLVAMVLLTSEVAARDLAETTNAVETSEGTEAEPTQFGGGGGGWRCRYGCCGRRYRYRCRCCRYPGQAVDADFKEAETHN